MMPQDFAMPQDFDPSAAMGQPQDLSTGAGQPQLDPEVILQEFLQEGGTPEDLETIIALLQLALQDPGQYPAIYDQLLAMEAIEEGDIPPEFDERALTILVSVFSELLEMLAPQEAPQNFAQGGLASLARKGRNGDTRLAHVTPSEERILRRLGGSGTVNPATGLVEFGFFKSIGKAISKVFKAVAPVLPLAMAFIPGMQGLAGSIGGFFGASTPLWQGVVGNAVLGGLTGGLTGGSKGILKGAALGGLGGAASHWLSGAGVAPVGGDPTGFLGGELTGQALGASGQGSFYGPATGSTLGAGSQLSGAVTQPIVGAGFSPSVPLIAPVGSAPWAQTLGRGAESLAMGAQGIANSPMAQTLKTGFDVGSSGLRALGDYRALGQQEQMNAMEQQAMEQLLAQGMDPQAAQQQVAQQFGGMSGSVFGDYAGGMSNWHGGMSPYMYRGV